MIITLKNSGGNFLPLDVFEDFEIKYNHQYEDYSSVGGKRIPYTNKFKIPTSTNNRNLCGLPFDLAYPTQQSVEGKMLYEDGTLAFEFIADIEGQTVNVLQPYIEISIIDKISKAISDMSKWKLSDMMAGNTFNMRSDSWMFGDQTALTDPEKYFLFTYLNYNNRNSIISYDPARNLSQLHPTFILNRLVDKMFGYVGLTVESDFLNLDDQLAVGIKANELGLTIPAKLTTFDDYSVSTGHSFTGSVDVPSFGYTERVVGVPSQMPSTSRLKIENFLTQSAQNNPLKMNYDYLADVTYNGAAGFDPWGARYCSLVDGKLSIRIQSNHTTIKPTALFGKLYATGATGLNNYGVALSMTTPSPESLDIRLVNAGNMKREFNGSYWTYNWYEQAEDYDIKAAPIVGTAYYAGISANNEIEYELNLSTDTTVEIDVKANQSLGLCYVLTPQAGQSETVVEYVMTDTYTGGTYDMEMVIKDGYIEYKMITNNGSNPNDYYDGQVTSFTRPGGVNWQPARLVFSFEESTPVPTGVMGYNATPEWISNFNVDMGESIKAVVDYSLMDILQMIMERYNLQFYSTSDGLLHLDTEANRMSGIGLNIDHLIDEDMSATFTINDNGILTVKDSNASFYDKEYNLLDKHSVSDIKKELVTLSFKSGIVNPKMFEDTYDDSSYDLLTYGGDSNYWGIADREQKKPSEFKPTFCFLTPSETPVYFPINVCGYSTYIQDTGEEDWEEGLDIGFYNTFFNNDSTHPKMQLAATTNHVGTGFKLVSFENSTFIIGDDNLFKQTWYQEMMDKMNDDSVIVEFNIYASEATMKILKDFPNIMYKGELWELKGFNDYPLSAQNGGVTKITAIKQVVWS